MFKRNAIMKLGLQIFLFHWAFIKSVTFHSIEVTSINKKAVRMKKAVFIMLCSALVVNGNAQPGQIPKYIYDQLSFPELVSKFIQLSHDSMFWSDKSHAALSDTVLELLDSAAWYGIDLDNYYAAKFKSERIHLSSGRPDSVALKVFELRFTDAVISFLKDLYQGSSSYIGYDEISPKTADSDNEFLLNQLAGLQTAEDFRRLMALLEPSAYKYILVKNELRNMLLEQKQDKVEALKQALGYLRWIAHFRFDNYIVVNIPSAMLYYYEADSLMLSMRVIAGKPSTRTPRFAAYCNQVVLYPYWNVPASIATKELLPMFKKNPQLLETMNMQVLDKKGRIVDATRINWQALSKTNFPYRFRQSTGCDNSLGLIKFNLTDPFSVYMHDTNNKILFTSEKRFFSHGCIRIELPLELANNILPTPIDSAALKSASKNQMPVELSLSAPIPVFVIYSILDTNEGGVVYYDDIYGLQK